MRALDRRRGRGQSLAGLSAQAPATPPQLPAGRRRDDAPRAGRGGAAGGAGTGARSSSRRRRLASRWAWCRGSRRRPTAPSTCCSAATRPIRSSPSVRDGTVLRSWGKGLYVMPHAIRVDPAGNVWTTDAASSHVRKFSPEGRELLDIAVGGQPTPCRNNFCGTTDVAFAANGHLFIADGYANARDPRVHGRRARRCASGGRRAPGRASSTCRTRSRSTPAASSTSPTARTAASSASISRARSSASGPVSARRSG